LVGVREGVRGHEEVPEEDLEGSQEDRDAVRLAEGAA
jgi:hypothetical protein